MHTTGGAGGVPGGKILARVSEKRPGGTPTNASVRE